MVKNHLKRISAPNTWLIKRKNGSFITRPKPGAHNLKSSISLSVVLRQLIKVAKTAKEAKQIINNKDVFVDKKKRTEEKLPVGIMDIVEFPELEAQYRILLDSKGRLTAVSADQKEAAFKLARIESKNKIQNNKTQLTLSGGRVLIVDKDTYSVGDTLKLSLPDQKIQETFKFQKGALALILGGKNSGTVATIYSINDRKIMIQTSKKEKFETLKKYAFVVGTDKPAFQSIKACM